MRWDHQARQSSENYQETFYTEMVKPISEGRRVAWDGFAVVPAGTAAIGHESHRVATSSTIRPRVRCGRARDLPDSALFTTVTTVRFPMRQTLLPRFSKKAPKGIPWTVLQ